MNAIDADYNEIIETLSEISGFTKEHTEKVIQKKLVSLGIYMTPREYFEFMLKKKDLH